MQLGLHALRINEERTLAGKLAGAMYLTAALSVAVMVAVSLTLLPALLGFAGRKVAGNGGLRLPGSRRRRATACAPARGPARRPSLFSDRRRGSFEALAIDAGFAGDTDSYGAESACVESDFVESFCGGIVSLFWASCCGIATT